MALRSLGLLLWVLAVASAKPMDEWKHHTLDTTLNDDSLRRGQSDPSSVSLDSEGVSLWLSYGRSARRDRLFAGVLEEFGPGGTSTYGGAVVPEPDQINAMETCDYDTERAFLERLMAFPGMKILIAKPCGGNETQIASTWQAIAAKPGDEVAPMIYTWSGDASEYPPGMIGLWLAFRPDNELGGFYMGMAACNACDPQKNMPIVFMPGPPGENPPWCQQVQAGFMRGLNTCPSHYNYLAMNQTVTDLDDTAAGYAALSIAVVKNPGILGVATCSDAIAAGVVKYWESFNNGQFAAGLFVASFGA